MVRNELQTIKLAVHRDRMGGGVNLFTCSLIYKSVAQCYCVPDYLGKRCQFKYNECQLPPGTGRPVKHGPDLSSVHVYSSVH